MGINKPRPLALEDDRAVFDCGKDALNKWFHNRAWKNQVAGVSRTNVMCDSETGQIVAYVSLASSEIRRSLLTKKYQRNMPDPVPALLLGQLAVDKNYQGQGIAGDLLFFAFQTVLSIEKQIGCFGVITHPIDDNARSFYKRWGFEDNSFDPEGSMIIRIMDLLKSQAG